MSKYTTQIRYICETEAGMMKDTGYKDIANIIALAIPKVFDFSFPIYDENYRDTLCSKILRHYYTREIGEETYGLWKLRLETKLNEIMPYYNALYKAGIDKFNPLLDTQIVTEYGGKKNGSEDETEGVTTTTRTSEADGRNFSEDKTEQSKTTDTATQVSELETSVSRVEIEDDTKFDKYADTPQGGLDGLINDEYLTNARMVKDGKKNGMEEVGKQSGSQAGESDTEYKGTTGSIAHETGTRAGEREENIGRGKKNKIDSTEEYLMNVYGRNSGDIGKRLLELKDTFLNIDMMIINDLESLFMLVW